MSPVPLSPMSLCLCVPGPSQQSQLTHTQSHTQSHTYSYTHLHSHTCSQAQTSALFTSPPPQLPSPSLSPSNNGFPLPLPSSSPLPLPLPPLPTAGSTGMPSLLHHQLLSLALLFPLIQNMVWGWGHPLPVLLSLGCSYAVFDPRTWLWIWLSCIRLCIAVQTLLCT